MPVLGNTRWAVALCSFSDVKGGFDRDPTYLTTLFNQSGAGRGGLFDYWHDMSYGHITLENSDVFGPYTMKYSYGAGYTLSRRETCLEAIRLISKETDVTPYYGFVAVVNGIVDGSSGPLGAADIKAVLGLSLPRDTWGLVVSTSATMDQNGWRYCAQCNGLWYAAGTTRGKCPKPADRTGGHAAPPQSGNYIALHDMPTFAGQPGWSWCRKCQGMWYGGGKPLGGRCPAGGTHDGSASYNYQFALNVANFPNTGPDRAGGQNLWRWCKACAGFWYGGLVKNSTNPVDPGLGACPANKKGHVLDLDRSGNPTGDYTLLTVQSDISNLNYIAHEMGHGYGLNHANLETTLSQPQGGLFGVEYGDTYCLMGSSPTYTGKLFPESGSGLSGANRDILGWIPPERVWRWDKAAPPNPTGGVKVLLAGLDTPPAQLRSIWGYLLAKIVLPERTLTIEFRKKVSAKDLAGTPAWDSALPRDGVIIREWRTWYSFGQRNWRWCSKCQSIAFGASPGSCPAGGDHALDGSDYSLVHDVSVPSSNSCAEDWHWCNQCQCLAYSPPLAEPGPCRGGSRHDHTGSGAYALLYGVGYGEAAQAGWKQCAKCNVLFYSLSATLGVCFADGGPHQAAAFSPVYTLMNQENFRHSFLLADSKSQDWRPGRTFVHDGANFRVTIDRFEKDAPVAELTIAQQRSERPHWWWCSKCFALVYLHTIGDHTLIRKCPAGLPHDLTTSYDYRLTHKTSLVPGQSSWYACSKCFALVYGGNPDPGACLEAPGRQHLISKDSEFQLDVEAPGAAGQKNWRWCSQCQELWWSGRVRDPRNADDPGYGRCPGGRRHTMAGSGPYLLRHGVIWP